MTPAGRATPRLAATAALLVILALTLGVPGEAPKFGDASVPRGCLICGDYGTADLLLNIALFVPLGAALRALGRRTAVAGLLGLFLSAAIELAQLWIPGRYTTLSDLLANSAGAALGAALLGPGPLALSNSRSIGRQSAMTALVGFLWIASTIATVPSLPERPYYGQWTADIGYEAYRGSVIRASVGGRPARSARLDPVGTARERLLVGDTLDVTFVVGPAPAELAPIFTIYDSRKEEILLIGAEGDDLIVSVRRLAADLRLKSLRARWEGALAGAAPGDTLRLTAWRHGRTGWCMRPGGDPSCETPTFARGWMLLGGASFLPPRMWPAADIVWLMATATLALMAAPGLAAGAVGTGVLATLAAVLVRLAGAG